MAEFTTEERLMERMEYARRDDLREEKSFWQNVFFGTFAEGEKMTEERMERGYVLADKALEEFRRRFQ